MKWSFLREELCGLALTVGTKHFFRILQNLSVINPCDCMDCFAELNGSIYGLFSKAIVLN